MPMPRYFNRPHRHSKKASWNIWNHPTCILLGAAVTDLQGSSLAALRQLCQESSDNSKPCSPNHGPQDVMSAKSESLRWQSHQLRSPPAASAIFKKASLLMDAESNPEDGRWHTFCLCAAAHRTPPKRSFGQNASCTSES